MLEISSKIDQNNESTGETIQLNEILLNYIRIHSLTI